MKHNIFGALLLCLSLPFLISEASASGCHTSYADVCVPIASDVDCAGGSGNGPAYAQGPFRVIGPDSYGLDRDKDGWGCEPRGWRPPLAALG